jgi:hypothetical protein
MDDSPLGKPEPTRTALCHCDQQYSSSLLLLLLVEAGATTEEQDPRKPDFC